MPIVEFLDCPAHVHAHCLQRFWTALHMCMPIVCRGSGLPCTFAHPVSLEVLALGLSLQEKSVPVVEFMQPVMSFQRYFTPFVCGFFRISADEIMLRE